jgi:hypothetical protein
MSIEMEPTHLPFGLDPPSSDESVQPLHGEERVAQGQVPELFVIVHAGHPPHRQQTVHHQHQPNPDRLQHRRQQCGHDAAVVGVFVVVDAAVVSLSLKVLSCCFGGGGGGVSNCFKSLLSSSSLLLLLLLLFLMSLSLLMMMMSL